MKSPLPQRLKSARKLAKLTQEQLGNKLGYERSHGTARISQYETGKHAPDFSTAKRLADGMGVPVPYLYCDDDDMAELILEVGDLDKESLKTLIQELKNTKHKK